jgi:hypothetical protein
MAIVHNLLPRIIKSGLGVLSPVTGVTALGAVLASCRATAAQLVVSPFEWSKLMAGAPTVYPIFSEYAHFHKAMKNDFSSSGMRGRAAISGTSVVDKQSIVNGVTSVVHQLLGSAILSDQVVAFHCPRSRGFLFLSRTVMLMNAPTVPLLKSSISSFPRSSLLSLARWPHKRV